MSAIEILKIELQDGTARYGVMGGGPRDDELMTQHAAADAG
jgi:hypothetical protein